MRLRCRVSLPSRKLVFPCHRLVRFAGHHLVERNRLLGPWQVGDMPREPCAFVVFAREALRCAPEVKFKRMVGKIPKIGGVEANAYVLDERLFDGPFFPAF
jgi:hypothetical protein